MYGCLEQKTVENSSTRPPQSGKLAKLLYMGKEGEDLNVLQLDWPGHDARFKESISAVPTFPGCMYAGSAFKAAETLGF